MLLASLTLALSSSAMAQTTNDTLVYVPEYLMQSLMSDLDKCDLERIELKKAKAELALLYVDIARKDAALNSLKKDLQSTREYNDTLAAQNMQMALDHTKEMKNMKHKRSFWRTSENFAKLTHDLGWHWRCNWFAL